MIEVLGEAPDDWDDFVKNRDTASAYHHAAVVDLAHTVFGLKTYFLVARDDHGDLAGVLPLVEQSSIAFGHYLISLPYFTYGGLVVDRPEVVSPLAKAAAQLARQRGADHVEFRQLEARPDIANSVSTAKISMMLALPDDSAALLASFPSKLRSQIRRGDREKPDILFGGSELLDQFYGVFAQAMHALGTPVYPKKFFAAFCAALPDEARILVLTAHGQVQAAAILVYHRDRMEVPWAAATLQGKRNSLNMRMYWEMLRLSIEAGMPTFDFGRSSPDSGTYRFKAQWGAQPRQLHWYYWLKDGLAMPNLNHQNPKFSLAVKAWQRMPLWLANRIGPTISKNLP